MLLDLSRIRTAHAHIEERYPREALRRSDDVYEIVAPVELTFDLDKKGDRYRLLGQVRTKLELACSRCVDPFVVLIDSAFDLDYRPQAANTGEGELEVEDDDLSTAYYEDDAIDLDQLIREQLYLALPMKPLCTETCRGLCPLCGINLNRSACACERTWDDPRLAVLKALKKDS